MKPLKVKTLERFFDKELNVIHEQGDEFKTSEDRAEKLKNMGFIEEIKPVKPNRKEDEVVKE